MVDSLETSAKPEILTYGVPGRRVGSVREDEAADTGSDAWHLLRAVALLIGAVALLAWVIA